MNEEQRRLQETREGTHAWKEWGPYLSERAWGTVREDYSADGDAWNYFPHDQARSRVYRWNEDGLAGVSDRHQNMCLALALWNGRDPILKERLFGLAGPEGNHGEDVKECYYYLDSTPTHSYMKMLYKYPQSAFPYDELVRVNGARSKFEPEYELLDTGVFAEDRYFDVFVEYAKAGPDDVLMRVTAVNRGPEAAELHLLPSLWYRNSWSWGYTEPHPHMREEARGQLSRGKHGERWATVEADQKFLGPRWLYCEGTPELLFTENESNIARLYNEPCGPYKKDSFHEYLVHGQKDRVNPEHVGTKFAAHYALNLAPGEEIVLRLRFTGAHAAEPFEDFDAVFAARAAEADAFYDATIPRQVTEDERRVMRQAYAGMLWSKQFYHYVVREWLEGDPAFSPPPEGRGDIRNGTWKHLYNMDVISMPDKWEYPWYAGWDLAFHCVTLALVDPDFAKDQLLLLVREWYMHPNGQIPAYEWNFSDTNPPVHAWAAWQVYQIEKRRTGKGDLNFLKRIFQKLLIHFTWWVNRKDAGDNNIFEGGFLGLDNIGVFDRSHALPTGGHIEQSDGTSWMAMFALDMLDIAMELSEDDHTYEDVASKFWEHFVYIAHAMNNMGRDGLELWNHEDGFFYDVLSMPDGSSFPLKVRSMVGLIPLFAVGRLRPESMAKLPAFQQRLEWFIAHRYDLTRHVAPMQAVGEGEQRLLAVLDEHRLRRILRLMLDEEEFLSPYGIRALSRVHKDHPYELHVDGVQYRVDYEPAESTTGMFGGNSNWRGPIWFPVNYLIIEALKEYHDYYGDRFKVECPTGSGHMMTLREVALEIGRRLS
ncbi:MAG TPA: glucosidase, partial [Oscillatoriaceae cyanobacterium]